MGFAATGSFSFCFHPFWHNPPPSSFFVRPSLKMRSREAGPKLRRIREPANGSLDAFSETGGYREERLSDAEIMRKLLAWLAVGT